MSAPAWCKTHRGGGCTCTPRRRGWVWCSDHRLWFPEVTTCAQCRRERRDQRSAVRQPPALAYQGVRGRCSLCGGHVTPPRLTWCSQTCVDAWRMATDPKVARSQLEVIHGRCCWACGEAGVALFLDHVRPLWSLTAEERGQLRWWLPYNLQLLCQACHGAKTAQEARQRTVERRAVVRTAQRAERATWVA